MTHELKPCGTPAAYLRHYRRGEPIDDACREAHRAAVAADARKARAHAKELPPCTSCGGPRKSREGSPKKRWCNACLQRWLRAGRPGSGPPPTRDPAWNREEFFWLLETGEDVEVAAKRVGVAAGTARNWMSQQRQAVNA